MFYLSQGDNVIFGTIIEKTEDYISYKTLDVEMYWLNEQNLLRKVGDNYIFNTQDDDQWWQPSLITITENNAILFNKFF